MSESDNSSECRPNLTVVVDDVRFERGFAFHFDFLPPVGALITLDKHLVDGGTTYMIKVVSHEWCVDSAYGGSVRIKAEVVE